MTLLIALIDVALWITGQGGQVEKDGAGNIVAIDLSSSWVNDSDLDRLRGLSHLQKLTLAHTRITDVGLGHLKTLPNVREFSCYFCEYITEDGIAQLKDWGRLEKLNLRGSKVTSKVFEHLAQLYNLRDLDVAHTQIFDDGFEHLAGLSKLERLAIGGNRLDGTSLAMLKQMPGLRYLDVGGIQRVDSGLWGLALTEANLKRLGELTQLTSLDLSGANLADVELDKPGHPEAEKAELRDLSALRTLVNLELLDLSRTPVMPEALGVLSSMPKIRELRIGLCRKIDDAAIESIRARHPGLRVIR